MDKETIAGVVARATQAAHPTSLAFRAPLTKLFKALELFLVEVPGAQVAGAGAVRRLTRDARTSRDAASAPLEPGDYILEVVSASPGADVSAAAKALAAAQGAENADPERVVNYRLGRYGWELRSGTYLLARWRLAPSAARGATAQDPEQVRALSVTVLLKGERGRGLFAPVAVRILPATALLFGIYAALERPEPPAGEGWDALWAQEAAVFERLRRELRPEQAKRAQGGREAPKQAAREERGAWRRECVAVVFAWAARAGVPLTGETAALWWLEGAASAQRAPRVMCTSHDPGAHSRALKAELEALRPNCPWEVRLTRGNIPDEPQFAVVSLVQPELRFYVDITNTARFTPVRVLPAPGWKDAPRLNGGTGALRHLAAEMWAVDLLRARNLVSAEQAQRRLRGLWAVARAVREWLRAKGWAAALQEWETGAWYGEVREWLPPKVKQTGTMFAKNE